jgi:hypothetical protein
MGGWQTHSFTFKVKSTCRVAKLPVGAAVQAKTTLRFSWAAAWEAHSITFKVKSKCRIAKLKPVGATVIAKTTRRISWVSSRNAF